MLRVGVVPSLRSKSPSSRWKIWACATEQANRLPSKADKQEGLNMRHSMNSEGRLAGPLERLIQTRARIPANDWQRRPFVDFHRI
jgi:hypothetical protein